MKVTLGGTMRRNDSCNFLIHKNRWIKIYCLYQIEMVIIRQKYLLRGWGYHGSVRGDTINRYEGVSWIGIYTNISSPAALKISPLVS